MISDPSRFSEWCQERGFTLFQSYFLLSELERFGLPGQELEGTGARDELDAKIQNVRRGIREDLAAIETPADLERYQDTFFTKHLGYDNPEAMVTNEPEPRRVAWLHCQRAVEGIGGGTKEFDLINLPLRDGGGFGLAEQMAALLQGTRGDCGGFERFASHVGLDWSHLQPFVDQRRGNLIDPAALRIEANEPKGNGRERLQAALKECGVARLTIPWNCNQDDATLGALASKLTNTNRELQAVTGWDGPVLGLGGQTALKIGFQLQSEGTFGWNKSLRSTQPGQLSTIFLNDRPFELALHHEWLHSVDKNLNRHAFGGVELTSFDIARTASGPSEGLHAVLGSVGQKIRPLLAKLGVDPEAVSPRWEARDGEAGLRGNMRALLGAVHRVQPTTTPAKPDACKVIDYFERSLFRRDGQGVSALASKVVPTFLDHQRMLVEQGKWNSLQYQWRLAQLKRSPDFKRAPGAAQDKVVEALSLLEQNIQHCEATHSLLDKIRLRLRQPNASAPHLNYAALVDKAGTYHNLPMEVLARSFEGCFDRLNAHERGAFAGGLNPGPEFKAPLRAAFGNFFEQTRGQWEAIRTMAGVRPEATAEMSQGGGGDGMKMRILQARKPANPVEITPNPAAASPTRGAPRA